MLQPVIDYVFVHCCGCLNTWGKSKGRRARDICKSKVPVHAMKSYRGSRGTSYRWVKVIRQLYTPRALPPGENHGSRDWLTLGLVLDFL